MMRKVATQELLGRASLQAIEGLQKIEVLVMINRVKNREGEVADFGVDFFTICSI